MPFFNDKAYVIAEIANAHQGDGDTLIRLIDSAASSGADAVKFHWFKYDHLADPSYKWFDSYVKLFIEPEFWGEAIKKASSVKLDVWVDIFDDWGLAQANHFKENLCGVKLPPTILEDYRLATDILKLGLPTLVGIGGWTDEQVRSQLRALKVKSRSELILMHGYQGYPTVLEDCNLSRIPAYLKRYRLRVGIADHVDGTSPHALDVPGYAICVGATVVEKHLTIDRDAKGYDFYSALEPPEFSKMVEKIRTLPRILGGLTRSENERKYLAAVPRAVMRRSMRPGETLNQNDVIFRRTDDEFALTPSELKSYLPAVIESELSRGSMLHKGHLRKPRVVIAVICRLKSTRLKRKALAEIRGKPSALMCLERCRQVKMADDVFLATSTLPQDDDLTPLAEAAGVKLLRGDPDCVLNRLLDVANNAKADVIVRVTGDCPVISPEILDYLIPRHLDSGADYTFLSGQYPVGLAGDIFSVGAMRRLLDSDVDLTYTEYLRYYFDWNRKLFKCHSQPVPKKWRYAHRLTLDVQEDLDMFNKLFSALSAQGRTADTGSILDILEADSSISDINRNIGLVYKTDKQLIARIRQAVKIQIPLACPPEVSP